jgi:tetratricopeptide (TPR) repeat protein
MRRITLFFLVLALLIFPSSFAASGLWDAASAAAQPDQLGKVNFPVSCTPEVQPTLEKALALLHSFQYTESEQTFSDAAKQDPKCAMAQWGKAMALYHQLWDFPQAETLKRGLEDVQQAQKIGAPTERERAFIAAAAVFFQDDPKLSHAQRRAAYSAALAQLHAQSPQDVEAGAFYALSFIALADLDHVDESANRKKAIAILDPLFHQHPDNPGVAHYLIHAADVPEFAPQGLEAARHYAKIAPDSSHAIHMPSHIFVRLGLWQESIASNIAASVSASHATEAHHAEPRYQTHAMDYLNYSYLQSGQEAKARQMVEDELHVAGASEEDKLDHQAIIMARNALELRRWNEAAALPVPAIRPSWLDTTYFARAIGAARSGDIAAARSAAQKLTELVAAREAKSRQEGYEVSAEEATDLREAEAWLAFAEGKTSEAINEMRAAAGREDANGVQNLAVPAREMLADMLLELKRPAEALQAYEAALKASPNRFDALYGAAHAAQAVGNSAAAQSFYAKLAEISGPGADRPELAETKSYLARQSN